MLRKNSNIIFEHLKITTYINIVVHIRRRFNSLGIQVIFECKS